MHKHGVYLPGRKEHHNLLWLVDLLSKKGFIEGLELLRDVSHLGIAMIIGHRLAVCMGLSSPALSPNN